MPDCWIAYACELKPSSKRPLFNLIISVKTLIKLKWNFANIYAFYEQKFSVVLELFSIALKFLG